MTLESQNSLLCIFKLTIFPSRHLNWLSFIHRDPSFLYFFTLTKYPPPLAVKEIYSVLTSHESLTAPWAATANKVRM